MTAVELVALIAAAALLVYLLAALLKPEWFS
jgi:K+-transporting ATPase KdpF subunit